MNAQLDISQNKALLWLMAIACGLCAGANYYSQPLIHSIQLYFNMPESQVALTVTFAQVSYALGLLFIVPMGDIVNKIKFIPWLMFCAAIGLLMCAFAVNLPMLWVGTIITGLFSVAAQVLIPLATMAVKPEKTGERDGKHGRKKIFEMVQQSRIRFRRCGWKCGICIPFHIRNALSDQYCWIEPGYCRNIDCSIKTN